MTDTHLSAHADDLAALAEAVTEAAGALPRFWPLDAFVASNPLHGFEDRDFDTALREARDLFGGGTRLSAAEYRERAQQDGIGFAQLRGLFTERLRTLTEKRRPLQLAGRQCSVEALVWHAVSRGFGPDDCRVPEALLTAAQRALGRERLTLSPGLTGYSPTAWTPVAWFDEHTGRGLASWLNDHCAAWCQGVGADPSGSAAGMAEMPLYAMFRSAVDQKSWLPAARRADGRIEVSMLAPTPAEALLEYLHELSVPRPDWARVLRRELLALPGWAAWLKWRAERADAEDTVAALVDYLGMRVTLERLLCLAAAADLGVAPNLPAVLDAVAVGAVMGPRAARSTVDLAHRLAALARWLDVQTEDLERAPREELVAVTELLRDCNDDFVCSLFQEAEEASFADTLLGELQRPQPAPGPAPLAQAVFCIDVRSERFRRALEHRGGYETLGYAGFFGVAIQLQSDHPDLPPRDCCPALIAPSHAVTAQRGSVNVPERVREQLKTEPMAAFGLVDGLGLLSLGTLVRDTLAPGLSRAATQTLAAPELLAAGGEDGPPPLDADASFQAARALFSLTGLATPLAPLVLLLGHGSSTTNNPWAAGLDCGACGGNHGGGNARVLAAILNDQGIRDRLAREVGIEIGDGTRFVAGLHDTTTDEVRLFGLDDAPASHQRLLERVRADLDAAGRSCRTERLPELGATREGDPLRRATDWSETRPEWGLARNAGFIAAPRQLTAGINLEGRCFLHSYDWRTDATGAALHTIMTAPLIVAQWINTQYYFSTVDNDRYGSGSKTTQNVFAGVGVLQGSGGDLRLGLPAQSVFDEAGRPYHHPLRLLTLIVAPRGRVDAVLAAEPKLRSLFDGSWLHLVLHDPVEHRWLRYQPGGRWTDAPRPQGTGGSALPDALHSLNREILS